MFYGGCAWIRVFRQLAWSGICQLNWTSQSISRTLELLRACEGRDLEYDFLLMSSSFYSPDDLTSLMIAISKPTTRILGAMKNPFNDSGFLGHLCISNWTYHELDQDPKPFWVPPQFAGAFGPENESHPLLQAAFSAAFETRSIRLDLDLTAPFANGSGGRELRPKTILSLLKLIVIFRYI